MGGIYVYFYHYSSLFFMMMNVKIIVNFSSSTDSSIRISSYVSDSNDISIGSIVVLV